MSLKLNEVCLLCQHPKCYDCREEYAQERNGKVYLLNATEMAHNEALRRWETHQLPVGPTPSPRASAEYANEGQTLFHTFTEGTTDQSEPTYGLDEALTRGVYTPCSAVEPQGIDPNITVSFASGDQNNLGSEYSVTPQCFYGGWGAGRPSNNWEPFVTNGTNVEPQTLAYNMSVGTVDWTSTSGHTLYTLPGAASLPCAAYCEYDGSQQDLSNEPLSQCASPPACHSKDITACNSCMLDKAVLGKPLACVFFKYNPEKHSSCMQKSFKDIGHLGQHVKKHHRGKIPPIPRAHQKNSNWKWYWIWGKLFHERLPPPKCPYPHPDQDMKAHNLHQFFRGLSGPLRAGVDIGSEVQSIVQGLSEPSSYGQFMDTLLTSSLAQHNHDPGVYSS